MKAVVAGAVFLPKKLIDVAEVKASLTVEQWVMGAKEATLVPAYYTSGAYMAVPRSYGLQSIAKAGIPFVDKRSAGVAFRFPKAVKHTGDYVYQHEFVQRIVDCCRTMSDFLVHAATGKGKTVCALSVAQKRGRATLVVVDQDNLMQQWRKECKQVLGLKEEQIGTVQGPTCKYEGCGVVVAMVQSLVQRDYPDEFYDYFGTVVFDEVHTAGAPTFSQALLMFSAEVRFGVSATIDRRDALQRIIHWNLGEVAVALTDKHDSSYLYYLESDTVYSWYASISPKIGRIVTEVSDDPARNLKIAGAIRWLYESGRDVLVVSDRIEQLENLKAMSYYMGIPEVDLGLYCGFSNRWGYEKNPTPKRRPVGHERGTEYTPVRLARIRKKVPKAKLAEVLTRAKVIFATFGMFAKGVDVKRLSGGIDCTPRSRAEQVHGRILRKLDGKYIPIWVTIRDINSYRLDHQFLQRIDEYVASSAEIYKWNPEHGVRLADVRELKREVRGNIKELKALNTITCADGSYTLTTLPMPKQPSALPGRPTARTTRSRQAG